jgi:hypothetical protein
VVAGGAVTVCAWTMSDDRRGCCVALHFREENVRLVIVFVALITFMLISAAVLSNIEHPTELSRRRTFASALQKFMDHNPTVNETELFEMMNVYAEASVSGLVGDKRPRWDFLGAFFYAWTVFATVG